MRHLLNQLIRQYFPLEAIRLYSIKTTQGSVPFESTLANDLSWSAARKQTSIQCCVDPLRPHFYDLSDESYLISRTLFKWILVDWYSEQPVGLRLPTGFKIPHAQRFEFAYERGQLLKILEADWNAKTADQWKPHPMFGRMSPSEWGKLLQIHLDYHLKQFSA